MEDIYRDLSADGIVIFSVPDCTTAIENGDISMLIHEHLNYFSVDSLMFLVRQAGFSNVNVVQGDHGGTLLCSAMKGKQKSGVVLELAGELLKFQRFKEKHKVLAAKLQTTLLENCGKTIGFYVPLRAIPYTLPLIYKVNSGSSMTALLFEINIWMASKELLLKALRI